jgi:hypothetical protein
MTRPRKESLAGRRQRHSFWRAVKKLNAEFQFQALNALGKRRLALTKSFGRTPYVPGLGHCQEIIEVFEPHVIPLRY